MSFEMVFQAWKSDLPILRYVNLNIWNYVQTLVECLPLFAYTEKSFTVKWSLFSSTITYSCRFIAQMADSTHTDLIWLEF